MPEVNQYLLILLNEFSLLCFPRVHMLLLPVASSSLSVGTLMPCSHHSCFIDSDGDQSESSVVLTNQIYFQLPYDYSQVLGNPKLTPGHARNAKGHGKHVWNVRGHVYVWESSINFMLPITNNSARTLVQMRSISNFSNLFIRSLIKLAFSNKALFVLPKGVLFDFSVGMPWMSQRWLWKNISQWYTHPQTSHVASSNMLPLLHLRMSAYSWHVLLNIWTSLLRRVFAM